MFLTSWIIKHSSACQGTQSLLWHLLHGQMTVTEHPKRSIHARRTHHSWKDPFGQKSFNLESFPSNSTLNATWNKWQNISNCQHHFKFLKLQTCFQISNNIHRMLYLPENHLVKCLVYLKMGSKGSNWRRLFLIAIM